LKTSWIESLSQWNPGSDRQPNLILTLGHPILMHGVFLVLGAVLLLVAAIQHWIPLLVITVFMLVVGLASLAWSRLAFHRLSISMTGNLLRAFHSETVTFDFELVNAKAVFIPWLEITAEMPYQLHHGKPQTAASYARERLRWATSVAGSNRIRWQYSLECRYRGDYTTGPLRLHSGDIFGFFPREMLVPCFNRLLVYPEIISLDAIGLPPSELMGDTATRRNLYEDISRIVGSRDYIHGDPLNRINWKSSARQGRLQVKKYESTTSLNLLVILDAGAFSEAGESAESAFELAVSAAASSVYEAENNGYPFGIIAGARPEIRLPVSSGRSQLVSILEHSVRRKLRHWMNTLPQIRSYVKSPACRCSLTG